MNCADVEVFALALDQFLLTLQIPMEGYMVIVMKKEFNELRQIVNAFVRKI